MAAAHEPEAMAYLRRVEAVEQVEVRLHEGDNAAIIGVRLLRAEVSLELVTRAAG
ncbi:MAG TPA: hypothetical protein VIK73_00485 [Limnochordales bacterium]